MGTVYSKCCGTDVPEEELTIELKSSVNGKDNSGSLQSFTPKSGDTDRTVPKLPKAPLSTALSKKLKDFEKVGFIRFIPSNPVVIDESIIVYLRILIMNETEDEEESEHEKKSETSQMSEETLSAIRQLIEDSEGIYRYNSSSNDWFKVISLSEKEYLMDRNTAVARPETSELWIWETAKRTPTECVLYKFDLSTNKLIVKNHIIREFSFSLNCSSNFLFFLNDDLYVFARAERLEHGILHLCVFDETQCRFVELLNWFNDYDDDYLHSSTRYSPIESIPEFIYLPNYPNNPSILRFGGKGHEVKRNDANGKLSAINWIDCDFDHSNWHREFKIGDDTIVGVLDGSYVLILCKRDAETAILVYELGINRFYESGVMLPYSGRLSIPAVHIEDSPALVTTFISYCWRLTEFRKLKPFPQSLSLIIANFGGRQEMLHILYEDEHYCISVADILAEKTYGLKDFHLSQKSWRMRP